MTAGLLALTAVSPASAADTKEVRVISMPSPAGAVSPDTQYAGLNETNVSVGPETEGLPCGECVPGAAGNSIGLPWPLFTIPAGTTMTVSTWFESTSWTGPCTAGYIMKQGNTIVSSNTYPFPGGCNAGYLYGVFFTVPTPATTGFTTVIGTISGGPNKSGADTFINVQ
jgi:hypothetical protein